MSIKAQQHSTVWNTGWCPMLPHGLPERLGRISYHILLALEKIKIQSMLSTEWLSFMYFCKVIKMCIRHICIVYEIVQSVWRRLGWYMIAANWEKRMQKIVLIRREIIVLFYSENISFTELWLILSSQSRESLSVLTAPIITVSLCRREHFGKTLLNYDTHVLYTHRYPHLCMYTVVKAWVLPQIYVDLLNFMYFQF